jgi:hypothetical protein
MALRPGFEWRICHAWVESKPLKESSGRIATNNVHLSFFSAHNTLMLMTDHCGVCRLANQFPLSLKIRSLQYSLGKWESLRVLLGGSGSPFNYLWLLTNHTAHTTAKRDSVAIASLVHVWRILFQHPTCCTAQYWQPNKKKVNVLLPPSFPAICWCKENETVTYFRNILYPNSALTLAMAWQTTTPLSSTSTAGPASFSLNAGTCTNVLLAFLVFTFINFNYHISKKCRYTRTNTLLFQSVYGHFTC